MIINKEWLEKQKNTKAVGKNTGDAFDPYVQAILRVGEKVLELMEAVDATTKIDAKELILEADRELKEGITGNMAAYVALIATKCHSRGEEFRESWNKHNGKPESKGVVNPAIITIKN